jgi:hypothetical protein
MREKNERERGGVGVGLRLDIWNWRFGNEWGHRMFVHDNVTKEGISLNGMSENTKG